MQIAPLRDEPGNTGPDTSAAEAGGLVIATEVNMIYHASLCIGQVMIW